MGDLVPGESVSIYEGSQMCGQGVSKEGIAFLVTRDYTGCL
jgi:hypothetical protein